MLGLGFHSPVHRSYSLGIIASLLVAVIIQVAAAIEDIFAVSVVNVIFFATWFLFYPFKTSVAGFLPATQRGLKDLNKRFGDQP